MSTPNSATEKIITQIKVVPYNGGDGTVAKLILPSNQIVVGNENGTTIYLSDVLPVLTWEELNSKSN